jgi:hypothetical protein
MNELPKPLLQGTFGELIVQIRLFQAGVQAAPPIKDSGNDLIAIRKDTFKAVQVRTSATFPASARRAEFPERFHILALVVLGDVKYRDLDYFDVKLDTCRVFLLRREEATREDWTQEQLLPFEFSRDRVQELFGK